MRLRQISCPGAGPLGAWPRVIAINSTLRGKISFTKIFYPQPGHSEKGHDRCGSGMAPAEFPFRNPARVPFRGMDVKDLWGYEA